MIKKKVFFTMFFSLFFSCQLLSMMENEKDFLIEKEVTVFVQGKYDDLIKKIVETQDSGYIALCNRFLVEDRELQTDFDIIRKCFPRIKETHLRATGAQKETQAYEASLRHKNAMALKILKKLDEKACQVHEEEREETECRFSEGCKCWCVALSATNVLAFALGFAGLLSYVIAIPDML